MSDSEHDNLLARYEKLADAGRRRRLLRGLMLPLRAMKFLITHPPLWGWALLPAVVNIVLFVVVAAALLLNAGTLLEWVWAQPSLEVWYDWLLRGIWYLVFVILLIGSVVVSYYLVLLLGGTVASPFNDKLSVETERQLTDAVGDAGAGESLPVGVARSAAVSLARLALYLGGLAVVLPLHFLPGIGSALYAALAAGWSALFLAIEYTDDTFDRRGLGFADKLGTIRDNLDLAMGFGAGTSFLILIPVINLVTMPAAVVAGTILGLSVEASVLRDEMPRAGSAPEE